MLIVGIVKKIKNSPNNLKKGVDKTPFVCYNKYIKDERK